MDNREVEERFWSKVDWYGKGEDECWPWTKGRHAGGYGGLQIDGHALKAHRVAYDLTYGLEPYDPENPIVVRHKCDNPPCCNPDHLELGTPGDNNRDTVERGRHHECLKTHCPKGHEYTVENSYISLGKNGKEQRDCLTCRRKRAIDRYYATKDAS